MDELSHIKRVEGELDLALQNARARAEKAKQSAEDAGRTLVEKKAETASRKAAELKGNSEKKAKLKAKKILREAERKVKLVRRSAKKNQAKVASFILKGVGLDV